MESSNKGGEELLDQCLTWVKLKQPVSINGFSSLKEVLEQQLGKNVVKESSLHVAEDEDGDLIRSVAHYWQYDEEALRANIVGALAMSALSQEELENSVSFSLDDDISARLVGQRSCLRKSLSSDTYLFLVEDPFQIRFMPQFKTDVKVVSPATLEKVMPKRRTKQESEKVSALEAETPEVNLENEAGSEILLQETKIEVLAIEDSPTFAALLRRFFDSQNVAAEVVSSLEEAKQFLCQTRPKVIVCDVHLGASKGSELFDVLKAQGIDRDIPVVMLSSDAREETELAMVAAGARAYISKSRDPEVLATYVRSALRQSSGNAECMR